MSKQEKNQAVTPLSHDELASVEGGAGLPPIWQSIPTWKYVNYGAIRTPQWAIDNAKAIGHEVEDIS